jgi:aminoacyl tRNA synthase complex-interacting multifunctional protein 1
MAINAHLKFWAMTTKTKTGLQLLNDLIAELEVCCAQPDPAAASPLTPAPTTTSGKPKDAKKGDEKAEKAEKPPANKAESIQEVSSVLDVNALDLRVGMIRKVTKHPAADKLYCEDIDVGEEAPRAIASGLVPYYTLEQMQDRKLIVVCNLKPRNLVGFKSHGMVLCAHHTKDDQNHVEFIDPPINSQPGDRIIGHGLFLTEPLTVSKCDKSKAWDILAVDLTVNEVGEATWKGIKLTTTNGEVCTAPTLKNVPIR